MVWKIGVNYHLGQVEKCLLNSKSLKNFFRSVLNVL